jgi:branched-chain amino acid transport system substrate-binding protein
VLPRAPAPLVCLAAALTGGCQVLLGSLNDCASDADCAHDGPGTVCRNQLCVEDTRCGFVGVSDPSALTYGLLFPLTTDGTTPDPNGPNWVKVISLIATQLNPPTQQGIGGRPLRLIACDTQGDPNLAHDLAQELVTDGIQALMSAGSSETLNVADVTIPAGVLLMSGYSQSPAVSALSATKNGVRLIWRTIPPDQDIAGVVVQAIAEGTADAGRPLPDAGTQDGGLGPSVAVLPRNDAYGQGFDDLFGSAYPGPQRAFFFDPGGATDTTALNGAAAFGPKVTLVWAFPDDITRLLDEVEQPAYAPLQSTAWFFNDQFLVPGVLSGIDKPQRLEGAVAVAAAPADLTSPAFGWLQQEYEAQYGVDPGQQPSAASYADAMMLLAIASGVNAAKGNPLDGEHLAQVLIRVSQPGGPSVPLDPPHYNDAVSQLAAGQDIDVVGASGPLNFDPRTGEAPGDVNLYQVQDGGFVIVNVVIP